MMHMFPRDEKKEAPAMMSPHPSVDAALVQAVDTVARRLVVLRYTDNIIIDSGISRDDWMRLEARVTQLLKELDRGEGPFQAAYNLLKARAEHEAT